MARTCSHDKQNRGALQYGLTAVGYSPRSNAPKGVGTIQANCEHPGENCNISLPQNDRLGYDTGDKDQFCGFQMGIDKHFYDSTYKKVGVTKSRWVVG
jgi:hypothetical protein